MNIHTHRDRDILQRQLVGELALILREHGPCLVFYSGGSGLPLLALLYDELKNEDLSHAIFAPADERRDREHSNVAAFQKLDVFSLLEHLGATMIDCGDLERPLSVIADEYDEQVKLLIEDIREFDGVVISLLGMGDDGHTAGIFPYPEDAEYFATTFIDTDRMVVGYDVGQKNQFRERITLTTAALSQSDYVFVYAVGENKRVALSQALQAGEIGSARIPARLWQSFRDVTLFTDITIQ